MWQDARFESSDDPSSASREPSLTLWFVASIGSTSGVGSGSGRGKRSLFVTVGPEPFSVRVDLVAPRRRQSTGKPGADALTRQLPFSDRGDRALVGVDQAAHAGRERRDTAPEA